MWKIEPGFGSKLVAYGFRVRSDGNKTEKRVCPCSSKVVAWKDFKRRKVLGSVIRISRWKEIVTSLLQPIGG